MADVSRGQRNDVENTPAIPAVATVVSIEEAIQQAETHRGSEEGRALPSRIAEIELQRAGVDSRAHSLRTRFRVGQDGRPPLDTLDAYYVGTPRDCWAATVCARSSRWRAPSAPG
jgi:hypothetical protein